MKIGVGLFGDNGHQIVHLLKQHPKAELTAIAGFNPNTPEVSGYKENFTGPIAFYESLEDLLRDNRVQLVSLCSPVRAEQAGHAIMCLEAGKHVYAEKPCALNERDLDLILETADKKGLNFHEMAGTAFEDPYLSMGEIIKNGKIGEVVQVLAQKSYPFHDRRPQDEAVDGGLLCQVGVHALRMIEHITGIKVRDIYALETKLGNPVQQGGLHMAASMMMTLENGGTACVIANYLNQPGFGLWGNENLRIFGTKGFVEAVDGGTRTRLVAGDSDFGPITLKKSTRDYFDYFVDALQDREPMPLTIEDEIHPTRMVIRAKEMAGRK